jgi:hypothetical protein
MTDMKSFPPDWPVLAAGRVIDTCADKLIDIEIKLHKRWTSSPPLVHTPSNISGAETLSAQTKPSRTAFAGQVPVRPEKEGKITNKS